MKGNCSKMSGSPQNPYSKAADAYGTAASSIDQRALEGQVLLKAALKLEELSRRLQNQEKVSLEDIGSTLEHNQKLWTLFVNETMNPDHPLPQEIKNNIASLGIFVFKRTRDVLIDTTPEKIKVLIDINRNIATGLMKKPQIDPAAALAGKSPVATGKLPPSRPSEKITDSTV